MEHEMSMDGLVHDAERLKELQALPLSRKILITQARIIEFVERMGGPDNVFVSLSGKDSTVLLHIARQIYPTIKAVFADTGLEFPENRRSAVMYGADIVRPKARFADVVSEYGYPLIGKEVAEAIYYARKIRPAESNDIVKTGGGRDNRKARRDVRIQSRNAQKWSEAEEHSMDSGESPRCERTERTDGKIEVRRRCELDGRMNAETKNLGGGGDERRPADRCCTGRMSLRYKKTLSQRMMLLGRRER